jgi:TolB-like protein
MRERLVPLAILLAMFAVIVVAVRSTTQPVAASAPVTSEQHDTSDAPSRRAVLVVLPFENLGHASDAYFASGVSDEIATRLAAISSIGVISRTTASRYAHTTKSIADIGEELGVDYVLEGSVRWDHVVRGSRVRIAPRLIRVSDDTQLWSAEYERLLNDVLDVQSDVATHVVRQLNLKLRADEQRVVAGVLTDDFHAYEAYLRGREAEKRSYSERDAREAVRWYAEAVAADPKFATAWARLGVAHAFLHHVGFDRTPSRLAQAKWAIDRATTLDPDLPIAHMAAGYFHYWGHLDYARASSEFALAWKGLPNDSDVIAAIAYVRRRQGDFDEAIQDLGDALVIDPQNARLLLEMGQTRLTMRQYAEAAAAYDKVIKLAPDVSLGYAGRVETEWMSGGSLDAVAALLKRMPKRDDENTVALQYRQALYRRNYDAALQTLMRSRVKEFVLLHVEQAFVPKELLIGDVEALRGNVAASQRAYTAARAIVERALRNRPDDADLHSALARALAGLGMKADAIAEATKAVALLPVTDDALSGPERIADLAKVYARVGETQLAAERVQALLAMPSLLSPAMLKIDPAWDAVRGAVSAAAQ